MRKSKLFVLTLLAISSLTYAEMTIGGEVVYRPVNYESHTKGNSFILGDFSDSSKFKINLKNDFGKDFNVNLFLESDFGSDVTGQNVELTMWKKQNESVEAQVRTNVVSDSATGAIRIIENADENTFIRVHATDKSTVTLRPFSTGTMQEVGDILQSYSLQNGSRGLDGEYKIDSDTKLEYVVNTRKYSTDKTNTNWDTGVDGTSIGYKLKATTKLTPQIEVIGEVAGNTAKDNSSADTTNLTQGKLAVNARVKYDNRKLLLMAESLIIQPNEAKTGTDKIATAIGGKIQYSDFSFIPLGNKAWVTLRHYSKSDKNEALFDIANDDKSASLNNSYTNVSAVGEVYWKGLTFAQELELKHMKDAYKNQDGEITDNHLRFSSFVKFYF